MNILLTGASGFLGSRLAASLLSKPNINLTVSLRSPFKISGANIANLQSFDSSTDWSTPLADQHVLIHAAGRAHIIKDKGSASLDEYRRVNVDATLNLAQQAALAGVQRFIFISSIGVNGEINTLPFNEDNAPCPVGLYAQSKWEAENGLWDIHRDTGMEVVIIRPPLVYGPGAPGNFGVLVRWVESGFPLPLGAVHNQRSLVGLDNLVDLIITCVDHPSAANQVFLAGDGQDVSTTELLSGVAIAMGKPSRLIPVPLSLLMLGATVLGKKSVAQRLLGSLQVDISKARNLLGWEPPLTVEEGLRRCFSKSK
jgi:nucleoside-diphosphate-sugar epimerase